MTFKRTLCLDFDGVLHSYTSKWAGATVVSDPPVEGARKFLLSALEKFDVCVLSSRSHEEGGRQAMAIWVADNLGGYVVSNGLGVDDVQVDFHVRDGVIYTVTFPLHKPPAHLTIDDRALTFTGQWPSVDELLAFKPWNKREPGGLDAERAIQFALSIDDHYDSREFLQAWRDGDTSEWPEFGEGADRERR